MPIRKTETFDPLPRAEPIVRQRRPKREPGVTTDHPECRRCYGEGEDREGYPCIPCGGEGYIV